MEKSQELINYERIASAITFVQQNFKSQPSLSQIAEHVHLSPEHFQRLFQEWAGTSPKKFLQYTSIQYAKSLLSKTEQTLFQATFQTGLSSTSRLHDLFVKIEGMSPAEYKNGGRNLKICYAHYSTFLGQIVIASTEKGICYVAFDNEEQGSLQELIKKFPNALFSEEERQEHRSVLSFFEKNWSNIQEVKLHLRGTDFQLKVWEALLKIPTGQLNSYQQIATQIGQEKASRAVGTAIGSNPIAFLIPCHRVIQTSGLLGGYRWGMIRKSVLIALESAQLNKAADEII
ncbi:bifunctional transcriptional activator/DNA repair enzyme AdaA [Sphingobacterium sp. LRF_L2]|uniref:bifunctional transcriptional activator/DNA repair enzyme AdaA n=1 Tax=Sphingobacterium sp. LRF_L2 TaxID=3369421 RepID=UPI003F5EBEF5